MESGKEICHALKEVRKQIAEANEIPFETTECQHKGNCAGTCPKCEEEVRYLENQLSVRRASGKAVSIVGLSMSIAASVSAVGTLSSCKSHQPQGLVPNVIDQPLEGKMPGDSPLMGEPVWTPEPEDSIIMLEGDVCMPLHEDDGEDGQSNDDDDNKGQNDN